MEKNIMLINGKLEFEGENLNGIRQNGKIYNKDGNVEFVIKYGNGNGKISFEGEYLNGKKWERKRI